MLNCMWTRSAVDDSAVSLFIQQHLEHKPHSYVAVEDLMRSFVQFSGDVRLDYRGFLKMVKLAKEEYIIKYKEDYLIVDHVCNPPPVPPTNESVGSIPAPATTTTTQWESLSLTPKRSPTD